MKSRQSMIGRHGNRVGLLAACIALVLAACGDLEAEAPQEYLGVAPPTSEPDSALTRASVPLSPSQMVAELSARTDFGSTDDTDRVAPGTGAPGVDAPGASAPGTVVPGSTVRPGAPGVEPPGAVAPDPVDPPDGSTAPSEPPVILSGVLEGDQVLDVREVDGVSVVQGFNSEFGRHFLDIGASLEDYGLAERMVVEVPALVGVDWGRGRARARFASDALEAQALLGEEGVVWSWTDRGREAGMRYGAQVEAFMVGFDGNRIERPIQRRRGQQLESGRQYLAEIYEGAFNQYIVEDDAIAFHHIIESIPETPIRHYVVRDEIELPSGYVFKLAGERLAIGEVAETAEAIALLPETGTSDALLFFPTPWAKDAFGQYAYDLHASREEASLVRYRLERVNEHRYILETRLDGRWLMDEAREFPVVLDPSARWRNFLDNPGGNDFVRTEPFNACAVRSGSQFYISAVPLEQFWQPGTIVTAASIYQQGFGTTLPTPAYIFPGASVWIANVPPLADFVEVEDYSPPPPPPEGDPNDPDLDVVEVDQGPNPFELTQRGTLLWTGIAGRTPQPVGQQCTPSGGWFGWFGGSNCVTLQSALPGWWGQSPGTVFRAPSTGHGDFRYRGLGQWIRVTMVHHRGFGSANWNCNGLAFQHVSCPSRPGGARSICGVYGRRFEGPLDGGFGSQEFPRVRLWYTEFRELDTFDELWTAELVPDSGAPVELPLGQDPLLYDDTIPESAIHSYRYEAREDGLLELRLRNLGGAEDLQTFVYLADGRRLCEVDEDIPCPTGRRLNYQIDGSVTQMLGMNNSLPIQQFRCQDGHVMVGLRAARRSVRRGFLWLQDQYFTTRVEPVCGMIHPDREGPGSVTVSAEGVWYGGVRPDTTTELMCNIDEGFLVNGVTVRMRGVNDDGIHGIRLRCQRYIISGSQLQVDLTAGEQILIDNSWGGSGSTSYNGNWVSGYLGCGSVAANRRPLLGLRAQADATCENRCVASIFGICLLRVLTCNAGGVRRVGPLCSIPSFVTVPVNQTMPDFVGTGNFPLGEYVTGDQLRFKIQTPGRDRFALYSFEVVSQVPPEDQPILRVEPRRPGGANSSIRGNLFAFWEPVPVGEVDYYESQIEGMCAGPSPCDEAWRNTCLNGSTSPCVDGTADLTELYELLPMNTCYEVYARAQGAAGPGPIATTEEATLVRRPVLGDIEPQLDSQGVPRAILVSDNVARIRWLPGLLPNQDDPAVCDGDANSTRFQARLRPCNADALVEPDPITGQITLPGFTASTAPGTTEREVTFPAEALAAAGCYDVDIRYYNRRNRFSPDNETAAQNTLTLRRWLGTGDGTDVYQLRGTTLSTSEIQWEWNPLVGASEFESILNTEAPVLSPVTERLTSGHGTSTCQRMRVRGYADGAEPRQGTLSDPVDVATLLPIATSGHFAANSPRAFSDHIRVQLNFGQINAAASQGGGAGFTPGATCGSPDPTGANGQAAKVEVKRCSDEAWFTASSAPSSGYQITSTFEFNQLQGPGCYDFRVTYRNQSNHENQPQEFRRWLDIRVSPVTATDNLNTGIRVAWNQQPDVRYTVAINRGDPENPEPLTSLFVGSNYLHAVEDFTESELETARPRRPTWLGAVMLSSTDRLVQWQAPPSGGLPSQVGYQVIATDFDGVQIPGPTTPSCTTRCPAVGRLLQAPLSGYELDIGQADSWFSAGSVNDPSYAHTNVPGPQIEVSGGTASSGALARIGYVELDGSDIDLVNYPQIQTFYQVRARNVYGPGPGSLFLIAERDLGEDFFQWQRYEPGASQWVTAGDAGRNTQDFQAPSNGDERLYRLRRTNEGTDMIAYTDPVIGHVKRPPGAFNVSSGSFDRDTRSLTFAWTASPDAETYAIVRNGPGGGDWVEKGADRTHTFSGLLPNRCYEVDVRATNGAPPDRFAGTQHATGFFLPPIAQHVEFAGLDSATDELVLRLSASYIPGFFDDQLCGAAGQPATVENQTAVRLQGRSCDGMREVGDLTRDRTFPGNPLEFRLNFDVETCIEVFALYTNRLGLADFGFRSIGEFRRPPTGTPDVVADYYPDDISTLGYTGGSFGLRFDWSPINGANGYFFELNGPPRITTADGANFFVAQYLQENTCYEGVATAYNFDGGNLQTGNQGQARLATMIRNPVFRSSIDQSDFGEPIVSAPADSLTCKPDESWDIRLGSDPQTFRLRVFNRPPNWTAEDGCSQGTNLTSFRYEVRRCDLLDGQSAGLIQSDWQANPESPDIEIQGHHCWEARVQYRNMDGVRSEWSHGVNEGWPRVQLIDLPPPEDMVQIAAGYVDNGGGEQSTITWRFTDVSRMETGWHVRLHSWSPNTNTFWCAKASETVLGTGQAYTCVQTVAADHPRGNEQFRARVRAVIGNLTGVPNFNTPFPLIRGDMSERITDAYTLIRPPDICGDTIRQCDATVDGFSWSNARDFKLTSVSCNEDRTNCNVTGAIGAPENRSRTAHTGARLTRQRIDVPSQPVVVLTQNECLPGHSLGDACANSTYARRGYGDFIGIGSPRYWEGRDQGLFTDTNLFRPGVYRYTLTYYNGNGIPSESTSVDISLQCEYGTGLGVCADGFPSTIDVPAASGGGTVPLVGNCQFPGWDGLERCDSLDWSCSGDPYTNSGGQVVFTPGAPCGTCQGGQFVCDEDGLGQTCENPETGVNACGGCNTLNVEPGELCEELAGCFGETICDPAIDPAVTPTATQTICDYDTDNLNVCGENCLEIPATQEPGESCGVCDQGVYVCTGAESGAQTFCQDPEAGLNSCNICSDLEPGDACAVPERSDGVPLQGQCALGTVPEICPTDGVMECIPNDPLPEMCNGLDDDCDGVADNNARTPEVQILNLWAGNVERPGGCDIVIGDPDYLCTAIRVRISNIGTDFIPEDAVLDLVAIGSGGEILPLFLGEALGRRVDASGSEEMTICWENPTSFFNHTLQLTVSDRESDHSCIDEGMAVGSRTNSTLARCGPEICDGYDSETGGLVAASEEPLDVCLAGQACGVDSTPATCSRDGDCLPGGACNVHERRCYRCRGQAVAEQNCALQGCGDGEICLESGSCVEGCWDDSGCASGEACVMNRCVEVRSEAGTERAIEAPAGAASQDDDARMAGAGCAVAAGSGSGLPVWMLAMVGGVLALRRRRTYVEAAR